MASKISKVALKKTKDVLKVVNIYVYDDGKWAEAKQDDAHIPNEIMKKIRQMCKKQKIFVDVPIPDDDYEEINYVACKMTETAEALCHQIVKGGIDKVIVDYAEINKWEFTA